MTMRRYLGWRGRFYRLERRNEDLINRWNVHLSRWGSAVLSNYYETRLHQMIELLKQTGFEEGKQDNILVTSMILEEVKKLTVTIELPEVNKLDVEDLSTLRKFSSGDIVEWSSLENVVVNDCPNLKKCGLGKTKSSQLKLVIMENIDTEIVNLFELSDDQFSTMTEYNIGDSEELGKALNNLQSSHFTNLLVFRAKNCNQELNKFLHVLTKRSNKLETLNIEQCKTLNFLFDFYDITGVDEDKDGKYLAQMKNLQLVELDQLEYICKLYNGNPASMYGFRNVQKIHIKSCPHLKGLLTESMAKELHQLTELKLEACERLYILVFYWNSTRSTIKFPSLRKVEFKSLSKFIHSHNGHLEFPNLKTLMIEKCPSLENFTTGFATTEVTSTTDGESFSELNEVKLDNCHRLVVVISSKTLQELRNLEKLIVSHCKELKIVFNIHEEILDCEALDKIVIIDKNEGTKGSANFSQLKDVTLENLTNLSTVFTSTTKFPSLETLKVVNCPALMTFVQESSKLPEPATSNHFFPNSLSLDRLKVLHLINQVVEKLWHYSCPSKSFCELENLTLSNNNKLLSVISSNMITRFNNLKRLTLDKCELLTEVFKLEDDNPNPNIQEMLPQLSTLALSNLRGLICVWNREPQIPFFPNLVSISIAHCGNLKSLFSPSSAKNLGKLKILKLCGCDKINEVISTDKDENVSIIFPEIECLVLKDLPKLVSFCQQNGTFGWPNLQTLRMSNIPRMVTFSRANLKIPLLRSVHITFAKKLWLGNLNNTIKYMHNNQESIWEKNKDT